MDAAVFEAIFTIPGAQSLKDKRMVVKSVKERCRSRFNVSVVESGDNDKWQLGRLGFALAAIGPAEADSAAQAVVDFLFDDDRIEILEIVRE
jgi:uncharacterized protein YlxP (DUF503 family)